MNMKNITAFIRNDAIEDVIAALKTVQIRGASISQIKGYGEYINTFSNSELESCARIEVIVDADLAETIAKLIMHAAHSGLTGDGLVAISPVDALFRVKELKAVT